MKELKTVSFGQDIGLEDSLVTTPVLPEINSELDRNVTVLHDVVFEGPVYGNRISVTKGPAEFKKSVYASDEIYIPSGVTGDVDFHGAVVSKKGVFTWLTSAKGRFSSDINAPEVKLKNCYVAGSIFAQTVELDNCVVLGGIFAKDLSIRNSMFGTLNSTTCVMNGLNYMIYPTSFTEEAISYDSTTELWNLSIADLGALFKGDVEDATTGKIKVNLKATEQKIVLKNDDESTKNVYSYSVASQVVIFDLITKGSFENHFLLEAAALDNQALKMFNLNKSNGEKSADLNTKNLSDFFFKVLNGQILVKMADSSYSFEEFMKKNG